MVPDGGEPPCLHLVLSVVTRVKLVGAGQGGKGGVEQPRTSDRGRRLGF